MDVLEHCSNNYQKWIQHLAKTVPVGVLRPPPNMTRSFIENGFVFGPLSAPLWDQTATPKSTQQKRCRNNIENYTKNTFKINQKLFKPNVDFSWTGDFVEKRTPTKPLHNFWRFRGSQLLSTIKNRHKIEVRKKCAKNKENGSKMRTQWKPKCVQNIQKEPKGSRCRFG